MARVDSVVLEYKDDRGIRKKMSEEVRRTRVILDKEIEERFPINYDAIQELAEKADELKRCIFVPHCSWYKGGENKYVDYLAFDVVLTKFYIGFVSKLSFVLFLKDLIAYFLAYRELFNLITDKVSQKHVDALNSCEDPTKAWELFNRIEYLINNFETEILLSDMEMKNE